MADFTLDPDSDEGKVRILIYDTDSTDYDFKDSYITSIIEQNDGDLWSTSADLCRALAAKYTKNAININLGKYDLVIDTRKKAEFYIALASKYESKSGLSMSEYIDSIDYSVGIDGIESSEYIGDI